MVDLSLGAVTHCRAASWQSVREFLFKLKDDCSGDQDGSFSNSEPKQVVFVSIFNAEDGDNWRTSDGLVPQCSVMGQELTGCHRNASSVCVVRETRLKVFHCSNCLKTCSKLTKYLMRLCYFVLDLGWEKHPRKMAQTTKSKALPPAPRRLRIPLGKKVCAVDAFFPKTRGCIHKNNSQPDSSSTWRPPPKVNQASVDTRSFFRKKKCSIKTKRRTPS